jgi:hypothetical protein
LFFCSRRSDIINERLPEFDPMQSAREPNAPSMRPGLSRTWTADERIKAALDEDDDDDNVHRLAERIAGGRRSAPEFKRYQTT